MGPYFPEGIEASKCLGWDLVLTGAPRRVGVGTPGILKGCEESSARGGRNCTAAPISAPPGRPWREQKPSLRDGREDTGTWACRTLSGNLGGLGADPVHLWLALGNNLLWPRTLETTENHLKVGHQKTNQHFLGCQV